MLAILGLLGVALAGTAFVSLPTGGEQGDAPEPEENIDNGLQDTDLLDLAAPNDSLIGSDDGITAETTDGYDEFYGGDGADIANGQDGGDYLDGRGGDDTLHGDAGDDHIHGGAGDDEVAGGDGDDLVFGYIGDDDMTGGTGYDSLIAGDGDDALDGGEGNDTLLGGYGDDTLIGGAGNDNLQGSEGDDLIDGVTGEETAERDYLNGSEGRDTLIGNDGDVMSGGADSDRFEVDSGTVSIMDYSDEDVLVLNFEGTPPELTTQTTSNGTVLLANGAPVASLFGVTSFDVGTVQLIAS
ncbi:Hemolysin-type calcium-binding repeat-containing protein [Octadecabacter temperatus]|uniref:Hemolysin, chromosomal n=1 Tax=Octadecabacter temperatus TaxID=1458307 RepID=A0A0K0Y9D5_9RHOB|nr:calcium-binding protein [Octadecabacter temperatus]AKS47530.1 Hemolysin, chromosomal [Octadecabacter temperatus]SIO41632.1 Hemolysin-type calcium-binding repeat-containing protein [Octadecabacter temperatus]